MDINYSKQAVKFLGKQDNISPKSWDNIKEVVPDKWDLEMLDEIDKNPDCHEFVSQEDLLKELNLTL